MYTQCYLYTHNVQRANHSSTPMYSPKHFITVDTAIEVYFLSGTDIEKQNHNIV